MYLEKDKISYNLEQREYFPKSHYRFAFVLCIYSQWFRSHAALTMHGKPSSMLIILYIYTQQQCSTIHANPSNHTDLPKYKTQTIYMHVVQLEQKKIHYVGSSHRFHHFASHPSLTSHATKIHEIRVRTTK